MRVPLAATWPSNMNNLFDRRTTRTLAACAAALFVYNLFLSPIGDLSHAGSSGSLVLGLATFYAWFMHERDSERYILDVIVRLVAIFFLTLAFAWNTICVVLYAWRYGEWVIGI